MSEKVEFSELHNALAVLMRTHIIRRLSPARMLTVYGNRVMSRGCSKISVHISQLVVRKRLPPLGTLRQVSGVPLLALRQPPC